MRILGIDTSNKYLGLAVIDNGHLLSEYNLNTDMRHASLLIPCIDRMLKEVNLTIGQINGFSISLGPGSFTGLRIGLATVKGLALAANKPLVGVPTLDVIARNLVDPLHQVCVISDARRNQLYWALYKPGTNGLEKKTDYNLSPVELVLKKIRTKTIFTGDGIPVFGKEIIKQKPKLVSFASEELWYPKASVVAELGWKRLAAGQPDDTDTLEPMYLYARDCVINKKVSKINK